MKTELLILQRRIARKFSTYWFDHLHYRIGTGRKLHLMNPILFDEKLFWYNRYWEHPLKTICADKYMVRNYVKKIGMDEILVPNIGVWNNIDDVNFDLLPRKFVLKCNHGCGFNIICLNKETLNIDEVKKKIKEWLSVDYSRYTHEKHYKYIQPKVICDELLPSPPTEYQFWCLNGKAESILVCRKNLDGTYDAISYDLEWNRLYDRIQEPIESVFHKPNCLKMAIQYAEKLASPFPFVRVDLYIVNEKIYLAELTFTPATMILSSYKYNFLVRCGKKFLLPPRYKYKKDIFEQEMRTWVS